MDQFRAKDLEPFTQFFDLMLDIFLEGRGFRKAIADVNIH
jgi:hypothetical protein